MPGLSIDDLTVMSPAELRSAWREQYRKPAPDIGPDLLRRGIAWQIQARVHGGLTVSAKRAIEKAHSGTESRSSLPCPNDSRYHD